jgi:hypothetical protein
MREFIQWLIVLPLFGALVTLWLEQRAKRLERQRSEFARAYQTIVRLQEMPYRIQRRAILAQPGVHEIVAMMHEIQQELAFSQSWIELESATVGKAYVALVDETKQQLKPHMQAAWEFVPTGNETMNIGNRYPVDTETERRQYLEAARKHLSWKAMVQGWLRRGSE